MDSKRMMDSAFPPTAPRTRPELDPAFRPAVLEDLAFRDAARASGDPQAVRFVLEQPGGAVFRFDTVVFAARHPASAGNFHRVERFLKFLLWSRGARRVYFSGPSALGEMLRRHYEADPIGKFDADLMGRRIYGLPFEVVLTDFDSMPQPRESGAALGRNWDGCRIGFDLGASDRKSAAVMDGRCLFSEEVEWAPARQSDPQWHFDQIMDSLRRAARHLPRVDAIGGSAAGVYVNNEVRVASLFRGVPPGLFESRVKNIFHEIRRAWGDIPFEVVNDGEVTALAGSMVLGDNAVLGLALGSSLAAGYVNPDGLLPSWLNELAFGPVDYNPAAPADDWSGDRGCGAQYLSQQAVGRLLAPAGIEVEAERPLPEKLKRLQELMERDDPRALGIYRTIGSYLGYSLAHYARFYEIRHVLVLGRVMTGRGGGIILDRSREVLRDEFPGLLDRMELHLPGEKEKRHGQAVAAASLPAI